MEPQPLVFFTTQTSATESIWRILLAMNDAVERQGRRKRWIRHLGHEDHIQTLPKPFTWSDMPVEPVLVHHNVVHLTTGPFSSGNSRFLLNFRDPRDVDCNQFYWQSYHRLPGESEEGFQARLTEIQQQGIDEWIINRLPRTVAPSHYYDRFLTCVRQIPEEVRTVVTYARVCLAFDSFIEKAASSFPVEIDDELRTALAKERPEQLTSNPNWVGGRWVGGDVSPGRFRRELQGPTIATLNRAYGAVLREMAVLDPDYAHLYLDGL